MNEQLARQQLEDDPVLRLGEAFAQDPFEVLRTESSRLYNVYQDPDLDEVEKSAQLDSYFRTIESLDRATFPNLDGEVKEGVPKGYIPDGFVDMGSVSSLDPDERYDRAMNYVDTYNTLREHKAVFESVFSNLKINEITGEHKETRFQQAIMANIAAEISMTMPYGQTEPTQRGGILPVSNATPAVCQQHALVAQVLQQAFGVRSRISKNYLALEAALKMHGDDYWGEDHVSNVVTINDNGEEKMYVYDTTHPQYSKDGKWSQGLFRMLNQTEDGSWLVTELNGDRRKYKERDNMYWTIQRPN